jgi:large subunit ribosomal protein L9
MQIILREAVANLGDVGAVVDVKPGYARNYLLPRGLAYEATDANLKRIERERVRLEKQAAERLSVARKEAKRLSEVSLTFNVRAGEEGRLFGSITSHDIADRLEADGIEIERRDIEMPEPIKALGVFTVPVRLHPDVRPEIKVWVVKEE